MRPALRRYLLAALACDVTVRLLAAFGPSPLPPALHILWWTLAIATFPIFGIGVGRFAVRPLMMRREWRWKLHVALFVLATIGFSTLALQNPFPAPDGAARLGWNYELFVVGFDFALSLVFALTTDLVLVVARRSRSIRDKFLLVGMATMLVTIAVEHVAPRVLHVPGGAGQGVLLVVVVIAVSTIVYGFCASFAAAMTGWFGTARATFEAFGRGEDATLDESPADETGMIARAFNAAVARRKDAEFLERAFGRYVAPAVLEALRRNRSELKLDGGITLEPRRMDATVLYADIRGFTRFSEAEPPEEVMRVLNVYFERMIDVIGAHQGFINKFIGDAVMVVFGAPVEQPDHPLRAVRCARAMLAALAEMNARDAFGGGRAVEIGIGVNTGPVVAGSLGSTERAEYTVIGDTVNVAARLTSSARPMEALVGAEAAQRSGEAGLEPQSPLTVKGKGQPLDVFRIVAPPLAPADGRRGAAS